MIDAKTEVSTRELCEIADLTKGRLSQLENAGIIKRSGRDRWSLVETTRALIEDARARSEAHSAARSKLEQLKAAREELRLKKECNEVVYRREFDQLVDAVAFAVLKHYSPLPSRIGGRDLELRRRCEIEVRIAQQGLSDEMKRMADNLGATGRAA
jgi:hypothetical protein